MGGPFILFFTVASAAFSISFLNESGGACRGNVHATTLRSRDLFPVSDARASGLVGLVFEIVLVGGKFRPFF